MSLIHIEVWSIYDIAYCFNTHVILKEKPAGWKQKARTELKQNVVGQSRKSYDVEKMAHYKCKK